MILKYFQLVKVMNQTKCQNKGGFFGSRNIDVKTRIALFYSVCIPLRIGLGLLVWFLSQRSIQWSKAIASLVLLFSIASIIVLSRCQDDPSVWWSRMYHLLSAVLLLFLSGLSLAEIIETRWIALLIWIDATWGFIHGSIHYSLL